MKLLPPTMQESTRSAITLDPSQASAIAAVCAGTPVVSVVGAPGTGKTTVVTELVAQLVNQGVSADKIMVLSATRRGAGELRNAITSHVAGPVQGALVRTAPALAFSILTAKAASRREPVPRLITGPEQDQILANLIEGYLDETLESPAWPPSIPAETLPLRGFRGELRDLMMRAAENGLTAQDLHRIGVEQGRAEWQASAQVLRDYERVTTLATMAQDAGRRYDPAQIVDEGAAELVHWEGPDRPSWEVVIVDDYQEATAATARLLTVLRRQGTRLVMLGDPDVAVQGFRGGRPALLGAADSGSVTETSFDPERLGHFGAQQFVLDTVHRGPQAPEIRDAVRAVSQSIASLGVISHRRAETVGLESEASTSDVEAAPEVDAAPRSADRVLVQVSDQERVTVAVLETPALEAHYIARALRTAHLREGVPWTDMAVVARSGSQLLSLRRSLAQSGVPVAVVGTDIPLRDEPAVRPLLGAIHACLEPVGIDSALDLLGSTIGGADAIAIRKLRRALRTEELRGHGGRTSDVLIVEALSDPAWVSSLGAVGAPLAKVARVLNAGREALDKAGATPQTVLWAVWNATGLAEAWQRLALSGSAASARADRDLDAVMSLFRSAETYVDRMPESSAREFVQFIESQDIPADSLSAQTALGGKVALVTPPGAAGREWKIVVVAGVQEGQWPDLRLRDSLLGAATLADFISGRSQDARGLGVQARKEIFYDELRAFTLSLSRATDRLIVTAVHDEENEPSVFLTLVRPPESAGDEVLAAQRATQAQIPLDVRGVTALARAELVGSLENGDRAILEDRVKLLRHLADQGVSAADPRQWYGVLSLSSTLPLFQDSELVPLSPSRVESVQRCALRWTLETSGGSPSSGLSQNVGTLIHAIAADFPDGQLNQMVEALDRRWAQLRLADGWPAHRQYDLARKMLEKLSAYYGEVRTQNLSEVQVERGFSVEVEGAEIHGIVDRLEFDAAGNVRIVDLKTGKTAPSVADSQVNPQLGIYQLAVLDGAFGPDKESNGASLVYVATSAKSVTTRNQAPIADSEHNWARDLIHDAVEVMRSDSFVAQPNSMCNVCPVRRSCPLQNEGQHVLPHSVTQVRTKTIADPVSGGETLPKGEES